MFHISIRSRCNKHKPLQRYSQSTSYSVVKRTKVVLAADTTSKNKAEKTLKPAKVVEPTKASETPVEPLKAPNIGTCEQVIAEINKYDWNIAIMTAIAKAESNCRPQAVGDTTIKYIANGREYGYSVGAFQVRILQGREHCDTFDVATNVKCAYDIYNGQGLNAWSVYSSGKYQSYL